MKIDIRNFILDNISEIKKMILTEKQMNLVQAVIERDKYHGMKTSAFDVSVETETSIQNASTRLKNLYDKGWLSRVEREDPSGGIYFAYFVDF
jgi:predicted transcriptional regulator